MPSTDVEIVEHVSWDVSARCWICDVEVDVIGEQDTREVFDLMVKVYADEGWTVGEIKPDKVPHLFVLPDGVSD